LDNGLEVKKSLEFGLYLQIVWVTSEFRLETCNQAMNVGLELVEIILWVEHG
jgi:hypothetical protein